jgi:carboxypeptidase D
MKNINQQWPNLTRLYTLSEKTISGRELWVLQISTDANKERTALKPMVKYIANMHGNEAVGREMMLALPEYLLKTYEAKDDPEILNLIENTDIHIMPSMNPDGFERSKMGICSGYDHQSGRTNNNEVDLNRNFPTWDDLKKPVDELYQKVEPETRAVMRWILENPFVLSINYHDGAVVANYPYDDSDAPEGQVSPTPDNVLFVHLSKIYASNHDDMFKGVGLCNADSFQNGITNGAQWYIVEGGMQDYNYLFSNAFELTVELSCCKYPLVDSLPLEWKKNKKSMVKFLQSVHMGVKGMVWDKNNNPVEGARIRVEGNDKLIMTSEHGEYWRLLLPGTYRVRAESQNGETSVNQYVTVAENKVLRVDFTIDQAADSSLAFDTSTASSAGIDITTTTTSSGDSIDSQGTITRLICLYGPVAICSAAKSVVKYFWN